MSFKSFTNLSRKFTINLGIKIDKSRLIVSGFALIKVQSSTIVFITTRIDLRKMKCKMLHEGGHVVCK